ncbi:hypothetical protein [Paenibacillus planticolens]|uniref:hypothetical protein n=1 Tax=Paenibacillus planticolens TaxID=2654976 RepID=UPI001FE7DC12|nr:hypothetical protein [Paenibacillus planticolens]
MYWKADRGKYQVTIRFNNNPIYLGLFDNSKEAARVYNLKAVELFGDFAKLNVIDDEEAV